MKILYFAWIRERIGMASEDIDLPDTATNVATFIDWMKSRGDEFAYALESDATIRVALDREHCTDFSRTLENVNEIALFPPMTGG